MFHLSPSKEFWASACVERRASQWPNYIAQSSQCVLFCPFSSRLCAFISVCQRRYTHALSPAYSRVKTYSCSLSGQLIMDFDYSHFVLLSVAVPPTGGTGRKASTIDCLSFGSNWAKWEWLLPEFTLLQCLHADPPERHSLLPRWELLQTCSHTHTHTFCSHIDKELKISVVCAYSWACRCYWELLQFSNSAGVYITEPLFLSVFLSRHYSLNVCCCSTHTGS